jgi:hypothetical protein
MFCGAAFGMQVVPAIHTEMGRMTQVCSAFTPADLPADQKENCINKPGPVRPGTVFTVSVFRKSIQTSLIVYGLIIQELPNHRKLL